MFKIILFIVFFPIAFPIWLIGKIFDFDKNPAKNDDICGDEEDGDDEDDDDFGFLRRMILYHMLTKDNKPKNESREREMRAMDLEPWQKDLVRKGDFDPENFEEDDGDLEEDDYYYEDS